MNVGQLIEFLQKYPKEMKVYLSKDAEGNSYRELDIASSRRLEINGDEIEIHNIKSDDYNKKEKARLKLLPKVIVFN